MAEAGPAIEAGVFLRRRRFLRLLALGLLGSAVASCTPGRLGVDRRERSPLIPTGCSQLLVVEADGWDSPRATLRRYERAPSGSWVACAPETAAVVGKRGMGWGRGLAGGTGMRGPVKREGDGRAPAGIFWVGAAFGYEPPARFQGLRNEYVQATGTLVCVDDPGSTRYNRIVESDVPEGGDWRSHEKMRRTDPLYRLGLVIGHNVDPIHPGAGSCIFLHIWSGPGRGTAGCTAVEEGVIEAVVRWVDRERMPLIVQLPRQEYRRLRGRWGLP